MTLVLFACLLPERGNILSNVNYFGAIDILSHKHELSSLPARRHGDSALFNPIGRVIFSSGPDVPSFHES